MGLGVGFGLGLGLARALGWPQPAISLYPREIRGRCSGDPREIWAHGRSSRSPSPSNTSCIASCTWGVNTGHEGGVNTGPRGTSCIASCTSVLPPLRSASPRRSPAEASSSTCGRHGRFTGEIWASYRGDTGEMQASSSTSQQASMRASGGARVYLATHLPHLSPTSPVTSQQASMRASGGARVYLATHLPCLSPTSPVTSQQASMRARRAPPMLLSIRCLLRSRDPPLWVRVRVGVRARVGVRVRVGARMSCRLRIFAALWLRVRVRVRDRAGVRARVRGRGRGRGPAAQSLLGALG